MKRKLLFLFVIASISEAIPFSPGIASSPAASCDDNVVTIENTYQNTDTLKADFVQTTQVQLIEKTITRNGRLFYQKGGKLRIEYAGDKMTHYITDGETLWVVDPVTKRMTIYPLKDSGLPDEALQFLTQLGNLRQYFNVTGNKQNDLVLKPKKKSNYRALYCQFNKDHYLTGLSIRNLSGNMSDYRFFNIQTGMKLSPKLFQP
ncbi:MAG: outer membrane lipoprotein carrier protein LolA [Deltaproteobacteria bacterium]|nr:outer membrane lipoprotein carrier protein LolA [Deltaproteobacteria bacterium]